MAEWQRELKLVAGRQKKPDVEHQVAWNTGIAACAKGPKRSAWQSAVQLFDATGRQRLESDIVTYNACLSAYAQAEHWKAVLQLRANIAKDSLRKSVISYGVAIKAGHWRYSQQMLRHLKEESCEANVILYNSVMAESSWRSAEGLLAQMSNEGCSATVISYNVLLHHGSQRGAWDRAIHVVQQLRRGLQPSSSTFNSAMASSVWQVALIFLASLQVLALQPSDATGPAIAVTASRFWQSALAMKDVRLQPIFTLEDASCWQHVLQSMATGDLKVKLLLQYNSALSACAKSARWSRALELIENHPPGIKSPDVVAYGTAMSACERWGQWLYALGLLEDLEKSNLKNDEMCLHAVIGACGRSQEWQSALHLFTEIQRQGQRIDIIALGNVMSACERASAWQSTLALLRGHKTNGVNIILYNSSISACAKSDVWQFSLQLLGEAAQSQLQLTVISYNAALEACERCAEWSQALWLLAKMCKSKLYPDSASYASVIACCESARQIEKVSFFLTELKRQQRSVLA